MGRPLMTADGEYYRFNAGHDSGRGRGGSQQAELVQIEIAALLVFHVTQGAFMGKPHALNDDWSCRAQSPYTLAVPFRI
ncbi:hypothetical protein B9H00_15845 [Kushneria marisflavi]|uniref:Uncharacterized protein n=1 Tax=Kushneria marisflavi TaxID=157779 RepID=A0A240US80_9GAMM|nr:hypothetical protein B9H00_15845 [Kushneria marisflavi]